MMHSLFAELSKQPWAMEPRQLIALFERLGSIEMDAPLAHAFNEKMAIAKRAPSMVVNGDTATIKISGVLMKSVPWFMTFFGIDATAYSDLRDQISYAAADSNINNVVFQVDSPGGQVAGIQDVSDAMAALRGSGKNSVAYVEDLCASAAYWLTSQAGSVSTNPNGQVGSIGVYSVVADYSEMAAKDGIKVHVVRSGEHKGAGVMGAPVTDSQLEAMQELIDGLADNFVSTVASGREMKKADVAKIADGRLWIAKEAKARGLVDRVESYSQALASIRPADRGGAKAMAEENEIVKPDLAAIKAGAIEEERSRMAGLRAAFPNDQEFALEQIEKGASVQEAKAAYSDVLAKRISAMKEESAKAAAVKPETAKARGAKPVGVGSDEPASGSAGFMDLAAALAEEKGITMRAAMSQVSRKNPDLYREHKIQEEEAAASSRNRR